MKLLPAVILEVLGVMLIAFGIGYEVATGAHLGFVIITSGSLFIAAGGLIFAKFYRRR